MITPVKKTPEKLSGPLRFHRLRGMLYAERRGHVAQLWRNITQGEYNVVKHLKYSI